MTMSRRTRIELALGPRTSFASISVSLREAFEGLSCHNIPTSDLPRDIRDIHLLKLPCNVTRSASAAHARCRVTNHGPEISFFLSPRPFRPSGSKVPSISASPPLLLHYSYTHKSYYTLDPNNTRSLPVCPKFPLCSQRLLHCHLQ